MNEPKDGKSQEQRASRLLLLALITMERSGSPRATYDVDSDRVVVSLLGKELARLGPKEWFMSDDELQQMFVAAIINNFGDNRRRPFREPLV
jgi:ABC-type uncharacterized transport system auxiliary subunit